MMTMETFKKYLKTLHPDVNFYTGSLNEQDLKCVGIYVRGNASPNIAIGGLANTSYATLPITLLVHWTESALECEQFANTLYNELFGKSDFLIEGIRVAYLHMPDPCAIDVARDENNIVEMVVRLNIIYER